MSDDELDSRRRAREAIEPLGLVGEGQKREAWEAWQESPDGVEREARKALAGDNPAALFMYLIRNKAHLIADQTKPEQQKSRSNAAVEIECPRCDGERFLPVGENVYAPCPVCNAGANIGFRRPRGTGGEPVPLTKEVKAWMDKFKSE